MLILPTTLDPPASRPWPGRTAVVTWSLCGALVVAHVLLRLAGGGRGLFGEEALRVVTYASASWKLYTDPELFEPWQLVSYTLLHEGWLHLLVNVLLIAVLGRAVERWVGPLACAGAMLTLTCLAAVLVLLAGAFAHSHGVVVGANGLVMGLIGMAATLFPGSRVRWGLAYYLVLVVGYVPLFRTSARTLALGYALFEVALAWATHRPLTLGADLGALAAGMALGVAGRRRGLTAA